jgi:hypothetical protein
VKRENQEQSAERAASGERLRFERLLSNLSARFVNISSEQVDEEINGALKEVLEFFHLDRCGLLGVSPDRKHARVTHASYAEGIEHVSGPSTCWVSRQE